MKNIKIIKNMKFVILLFVVFIFHSNNNLLSYPKYSLGVGFSYLNGAGLAGLIELDNTSVISINGFVYYKGDEPPLIITTYGNFGLGYQYNLMKDDLGRLFINSGVSTWYLEDRDYTIKDLGNDKTEKVQNNRLTRIFSYGIGLGYDLDLSKNIHISGTIDLISQNKNNREYNSFIMLSNNNNHIGIGGGIAIYYRF